MTHTTRAAAAAVLLICAQRSLAQAPVVTANGDPTLRSDTIYKLAIDKPEYPDQSTVVLLDDGIVRIEADGRTSETYHQIIQILRESAVENYQERSFTWVPGRQTLRINWFRVVLPNGTVVSAKPSQIQDSDVPAEITDPVYSDERVRRLSISGVKVGTLIDYSYTVGDTIPFPPNDHMSGWNVSMGSPVRRSRLILDVPASVTPTIIEENLDFKRQETTAHGRHVYVWAKADVPHVTPEPFAADSNGVYMEVTYALPRTWTDVGRWYASLSRDRYTLGPAARKRISEAVAAARTRDDSIRALHKFVAQDIRYVAVALGRGGYRPRRPDEVVATGFGDCKDKATLFVAALRSWGIAADPVLLRTAKVDRRVPSASQFNHAIAAIEKPNGGYQFVDLTASLTPFGELPYGPQGEFGLVVRGDGRIDEVTLPLTPVIGNLDRTRIVGELTADGIFNGIFEQTGVGVAQGSLREAFETPLDSTQRAQLIRALASNIYPGTTGDSLVAFDGKDLTAPARVALRLRGGRAATKSGNTLILSLNVRNAERMTALAEQLEARTPRRFTIDAATILDPVARETELRYTLPAGWQAQLPPSVHATSDFGEYHAEYAQEGRDLVVRHRVVGGRGVYAPGRIGDLIAWIRAMAKDDARFIVLQPAAGAGGSN